MEPYNSISNKFSLVYISRYTFQIVYSWEQNTGTPRVHLVYKDSIVSPLYTSVCGHSYKIRCRSIAINITN